MHSSYKSLESCEVSRTGAASAVEMLRRAKLGSGCLSRPFRTEGHLVSLSLSSSFQALEGNDRAGVCGVPPGRGGRRT